MTRHCPSCGRPIAERKSLRCLYCDAEIPPAAHYSPEEQVAMDREQEEIEAFLLGRKLQELADDLKRQQSVQPSTFAPGQ